MSQTWAGAIGTGGERLPGDKRKQSVFDKIYRGVKAANFIGFDEGEYSVFAEHFDAALLVSSEAVDIYPEDDSKRAFTILMELKDNNPEKWKELHQEANNAFAEAGFFTDTQFESFMREFSRMRSDDEFHLPTSNLRITKHNWFGGLDPSVQSAIMSMLGSGSFTPERESGGGLMASLGRFIGVAGGALVGGQLDGAKGALAGAEAMSKVIP